MSWSPKLNAAKLQQECNRLGTALIRAQEQLKVSQRLQTGMRIALTMRANRISELAGKVEQLQARNKQLNLEAEFLAQMVRITPPPADAATPAAAK